MDLMVLARRKAKAFLILLVDAIIELPKRLDFM